MKVLRFSKLAFPCVLLLGLLACEDSKTTTGPGAIATVRFNAPNSVTSGQSFRVDVDILNIGINGVHNGRVDVTLPAPLTIVSIDASPGTSATFSNGSGAAASWTLNTLDSNSQSSLHITTTGTLPSGSGAMSLTLRAALTADGIRAGDAVASATMMLMP